MAEAAARTGLDQSADSIAAVRDALLQRGDAYAREQRCRRQHQAEWSAFVSSLPERSWVREIVGQV